MTNTEIQIKVQERLNKLSSKDYDNIECWQIVEAFNKAQLEWVRNQINGKNQQQYGEGSSKVKYDDIQLLNLTIPLGGTNFNDYFESELLPKDYLNFDNVSAYATDDCCPDRKMVIYLIDQADLNVSLRDENTKPSFDWAETICTISSNKLTIYTDAQFRLSSVKLTYYRKPTPIAIGGCIDINTGQASIDVPCEFKDDIAEILVDATVAILAGDIESFNQYTRATTSVQINT